MDDDFKHVKDHGQKTVVPRKKQYADGQGHRDSQGSAETKDDSEQTKLENSGHAF